MSAPPIVRQLLSKIEVTKRPSAGTPQVPLEEIVFARERTTERGQP